MILTRRLEVQLAEMDKADLAEKDKDNTKKQDSINSDIKPSTTSTSISSEIEDEKERTIAKAALTIAELSQSIFVLSCWDGIDTAPLSRFTFGSQHRRFCF